MKKSLVAAVVAGSFVVGGTAAMVMFQPAGAQTSPSTTVAPATGSTPGASGSATSNEDPTHEATESPQREADENSGKAFGRGAGHHGPNEDPAHEATETPEREAQENSGQAPAGQAPADSSSTTTTPSSPAA